MKTVSIKLVPGFKYQQQIAASNHIITCDVAAASGGADGGPDPKDLVLGGLGSCIAITLLMVAPHKKWDIQSIAVNVSQSDEPVPGTAGKRRFLITEEIEVQGNLTQSELDDIKLTAQKCPVYKLLTEPKRTITTVKLATTKATTSSPSPAGSSQAAPPAASLPDGNTAKPNAARDQR